VAGCQGRSWALAKSEMIEGEMDEGGTDEGSSA